MKNHSEIGESFQNLLSKSSRKSQTILPICSVMTASLKEALRKILTKVNYFLLGRLLTCFKPIITSKSLLKVQSFINQCSCNIRSLSYMGRRSVLRNLLTPNEILLCLYKINHKNLFESPLGIVSSSQMKKTQIVKSNRTFSTLKKSLKKYR